VAKAAFVGAFPVSARFNLGQGFDHYDDELDRSLDHRRPPERRAEEVFGRAVAWIGSEEAGQRPFVWAHAFDPHYPYEPPRPWPAVARTIPGGGDYEGEVAYTDRELGRLLRGADAADPSRRATVLVVGDHGESLGAHGEITHALFVYDATQRVPFLLAGPDVAPGIETRQRRLVDVAPTLLAAYGIAPAPEHAGTPLPDPPAEEAAYVETKHTELMRGWAPLHGVRTPRWKYIRAPRPELYDLVADPAERNDLHEQRPEIVEQLGALLDAWLREAGDAGPVGPLDEETAAALQSLGYIAAIEPGGPADLGMDPKDGAPGAAALFRGQEAYMERNLVAAERHLLRAIELDPESKEAHSYLAGTYVGLRRYEDAVRHGRRALALPPRLNDGPIHATVGEALLALGRPEEALVDLRAALESRPGDPKVLRMIRDAEQAAR
jgi:hypothetical protein